MAEALRAKRVLLERCPIRVGDQVSFADQPDLQAKVTNMYCYTGIIRCSPTIAPGKSRRGEFASNK